MTLPIIQRWEHPNEAIKVTLNHAGAGYHIDISASDATKNILSSEL